VEASWGSIRSRRLWSTGIESSDGVRLIFVERFVTMHLLRALFLTFWETGYIETDELLLRIRPCNPLGPHIYRATKGLLPEMQFTSEFCIDERVSLKDNVD
jgi:hypothetical protein